MEIVLATRNLDKIREIKDILSGSEINVLTLENFSQIPELVEDGDTLEQNAYKKAKTVFDITGLLTLSDDTGLEVDALDGQPGVYSSRFAGENVSYDDNVNKLLEVMTKVPQNKRTARFRCIIALVGPKNVEQFAEGICEGEIIEKKRGSQGFGYDPVFFVPEYQKTFAEMPLILKNKISHRGRALQKAVTILRQITATYK